MPPQAVDLTGTYEIQNVASELALTVSEASESEGAAIIQASFVSGATDSLWTFVSSDASGYYRIQNVKSGLGVNVSNASGVIGALMVQQASVQAVPFTDRWLPIHNSDGTFSFCNLATALALDDPRASTAEKTQLDQWYPNGSNAQAFKLIAQVAVGGAGGVGGATDAGGSPGSGAVGSDAGPSGIGGASGTAGAPSVGTGSVGGGAGMSGESSAGNTSTPSVDGGSTTNGTKATKGCGCRTAASTSSSRLADALALVVLAAGLFRRRPRIR
jgi:MYXO-CTERM domain-containing protein